MPLTFFGAGDSEAALPGNETAVKPDEKRRGPGRPKGSTNRVNTDALGQQLHDKLIEEFLIPVAMASPLAAANIEARAEKTSKAVARLAAKNPKVRKAVQRMIEGSDVVTVIAFPISTAICVMVDMGMMGATAIPAKAVGVPRLWDEVYDEPIDEAGPDYSNARRGLLAEV